jgi:hypothetical protein
VILHVCDKWPRQLAVSAQAFWGRLCELKVTCVQLHAGADPASGQACTQGGESRRGTFDDAQMEMLSHFLSLLVNVQRLDMADMEGNVKHEERHKTMGKHMCRPHLLSFYQGSILWRVRRLR